MKRIITVIIAALLAASLAACTGPVKPAEPTDKPVETEQVTDAPATEEPTEEPTAEPTEEPVVDNDSYYTKLEVGVPYEADIDLDGAPDTIVINNVREGEYDNDYTITVTRACAPDKPLKYSMTHCYDVFAWVLDCDKDDNTLDVVFSYDYDSDDWTCAAIRMKADGSDLVNFEDYMAIPEIPASFTGEQGFVTYTRFDILGTHDLSAYFTVDDSGFVFAKGGEGLTGPFSVYSYPVYEGEDYSTLTLLREMEVYPVDENGQRTGTRTVPVGDTVTPVLTDGESFAVVRLSDGTLAEIDVEVTTGDDWGIFINGVNQDEYAEIPYAD